ncbi:MAG: YebC/PmpR family DNA-binding transcriptional regulator [Planctomycetota bacterium]|nr:MAG: YebC/PmpR family DNA-binding transcriptional regulator [Planctomycetota bacterium]
MAGHSHWAGIKHKKAAVDKKRGKLFSKLAKLIIIAAKEGGGDPEANPKLKNAIEHAKAANMPKENIERAIKRGTGEISGANFEELTYEGYGPQGVAIIIQILTDNRNRTAPEIRKIMEKYGGNLSGSVAWNFEKKGVLVFSLKESGQTEDYLTNLAIEAGAEDIDTSGDILEVITTPEEFQNVRQTFSSIPTLSAEITLRPKTTVKIEDENTAKKILKLLEELEDHDDVQQVYSNYDIPDTLLAQLSQNA